MNFIDIIKKIVLPIVTLISVLGCVYMTYMLVVNGALMGAVCTALLTLALGYFTYRDARMLLGK